MAEATSIPINEASIGAQFIAPLEASNPTETEAPPDTARQDEAGLDAEFEDIEEELIIEDFTIDGICGVY